MFETTAIFLLTTPPLQELPESIASIAEKFRYDFLTKNEALSLIKENCSKQVEKFIQNNKQINLDLSKI